MTSKDLGLTADVSFSGKPGETWAALRALQAGIGAVADKVRDEVLAPFSDEAGVNSFKTPLGKVYSSTKEERVEILPSADLMEWIVQQHSTEGAHKRLWEEDPIIEEHFEQQFDERQLTQATDALARLDKRLSWITARDRASQILSAAFRPRLVPEKLAPWVIPYLIERARIANIANGLTDDQPYVYDSVTGEEWPWATVIPESVTWNVRLTDDVKIAAGNAILERIDTVTAMLELEM